LDFGQWISLMFLDKVHRHWVPGIDPFCTNHKALSATTRATTEVRMSDKDPVEATVKQVMDQLSSTVAGRSEVQRIGTKDDDLTAFQKQHSISNEIAEAAIKEWVLTHRGQCDWNLQEVKAICLRNKEGGIPKQYLPESKK
jgi:hypothetical protein